jgi:hypothetical protein
MEWKFFLGASFLTSAILVPQAGIRPVAEGIMLAGAILGAWWVFQRGRRQ